MSFVVSRSHDGETIVHVASSQNPHAETHAIARACLAASFAVVTLCMVIKTSGAQIPWMGGLLGLAAGLAGSFVFLGWQEFTDDLARRHRRAVEASRR